MKCQTQIVAFLKMIFITISEFLITFVTSHLMRTTYVTELN